MSLNISLGLLAATNINVGITTRGIDYDSVADQIAAGSYDYNSVYLLSRNNSTGKFDSGSHVDNIGVGQMNSLAFAPAIETLLVANANFGSISVIGKDSSSKFSGDSPRGQIHGFNSPADVFYAAALDQIVVINGGSNSVSLISRNSSTSVFDENSPVATMAALNGTFYGSYATALDIILCSNRDNGSISLFSRNTSTSVFDASSPRIDISLSGSNPYSVFYYDAFDRIVVACGENNKVAIIARNPSTSIFDTGAIISYITVDSASGSNCTWAVYDATVQKLFVFGLNLSIYSLNPSTNTFDSGSAVAKGLFSAKPYRGFYIPSLDRIFVSYSTSTLSLQPYLFQSAGFVSASTQTIPTTTATWQTVASTIYFDTTDSSVAVTQSYSYEDLSLFLGGVAGAGLINLTRTSDTTATLNENLKLLGTTAITGLYSLTIGANKKLILGTRSSYDETITIPATGTIVCNRTVDLSGLTIATGATLDNTSSSDITVTIGASGTPVVASPTTGGGSITVVAALVSLTLTNLAAGSEVQIFRNSDFYNLGGSNSTGTTFTYSYSYATDVPVTIVVLSETYKNLAFMTTLTDQSNSIPIQQEIDRVYS